MRKPSTDFLATTVFTAAADAAFGVWTIPSPSSEDIRCCPSSLYTFPISGLARDWHQHHLRAFPDFEQFCILRFRRSTQSLSPLRLPVPPRELIRHLCAPPIWSWRSRDTSKWASHPRNKEAIQRSRGISNENLSTEAFCLARSRTGDVATFGR